MRKLESLLASFVGEVLPFLFTLVVLVMMFGASAKADGFNMKDTRANVINRAYQDGYYNGYEDGEYDRLHKRRSRFRNRNYKKGFRDGYLKGLQEGRNDIFWIKNNKKRNKLVRDKIVEIEGKKYIEEVEYGIDLSFLRRLMSGTVTETFKKATGY